MPSAISTYTKTNSYQVPRGTVGFQELNANGTYEGIEWLGDVSEQSINVETDNITHESHEGGLGQTDLDEPIRVRRAGTIVVDNVVPGNIARFLGGSITTVTQDATPVTGETITNVKPGRAWMFGATENALRIRNVSSVTCVVKAAARANSTAYTVGQIYQPATPNTHLYVCTVAGTSDAAPPTFNVAGSTHADGTATFKDCGLLSTLVAGTDYIVDAERGLISAQITGKIATLYANLVTAVGVGTFVLELTVGYTPSATAFTRIQTGTVATKKGRLLVEQFSPIGSSYQILMPSATLAPGGDFPLISSADEPITMPFAIGINILNSSTPAIQADQL